MTRDLVLNRTLKRLRRIDRRTLLLGVAALAVVVAAVTATAIDHRSSESAERKSVSRYVAQVNEIQTELAVPLTRVLLTFRSYTDGTAANKHIARDLRAAAATLERLRARLTAVTAPPEAQKLRRLLLDLIRRQVAITHEVQAMASFSPPFAKLLTRAERANATLTRSLKAIQVPAAHSFSGTRAEVRAAQIRYIRESQAAAAAQAGAIERYDDAVGGVARQLDALTPPPALAPALAVRIVTLRHVAAAGDRLAAELRKRERSDVPTLSRAFTVASREAQTVGAQRAQIAAIRAYNKRARELGALSRRVRDELQRLSRTLP